MFLEIIFIAIKLRKLKCFNKLNTMDEENEVMGETCRNGKPWDQCNCC